MLDSYNVAIARHRALRWEAYAFARARTLADGAAGTELRLADIDRRALEVWSRSWSGRHRFGAGGWDWPTLIERQPRRAAILSVAIWYGDDLCGLALGHASRPNANSIRRTVTLTHVERRPEPPDVPLRRRVIPISIAVAEGYGLLLGASRVRLQNPDQNLLRHYERLGFAVVWKGDKPIYCEREIR